MNVYDSLVAALGNAYDSGPMVELLSALPTGKPPKKEGGHRASLTFKPLGIYLLFRWRHPQWVLSTAMLYPGGTDRFAAFPEPLAGRLAIASNRAKVREVLGIPSRSGGSGALLSGGIRDMHWDRYDRDGHSLRFDFEDAEGAINLVSLMSAGCAAALNPDLRSAEIGN